MNFLPVSKTPCKGTRNKNIISLSETQGLVPSFYLAGARVEPLVPIVNRGLRFSLPTINMEEKPGPLSNSSYVSNKASYPLP